tara:strand:- start:705 stop:1577 length:873 start_codon:yes stop_codon:yes gene_type:complete
MKKMNIFCFGFGQVAKSFIKKLKSEKINFELNTTSREDTKNKIFENIKYKSFNLSDAKFDINLIEKLQKAHHVLISIAPINGQDIVLKQLSTKLKFSNLKWITYLSATSVYGNHDGNWVDETSLTNPTSFNGKNRLNVENSWIEVSKTKNLPIQIFRLSGIYSYNFNILKRLKSGEAKIINKKNHFFSRIHVDDIGNILHKSLTNFKNGEIYNISDDKPASNEEVIMYGIKLLGIKKPKTIDVSDIKSEMLKNFYNDSKRVSNKKMKNYFGYELKYPSYIEGLNYINHSI